MKKLVPAILISCLALNANAWMFGGFAKEQAGTILISRKTLPPPDTTPPTLTGTVSSSSVTSTTATISWPSASDDRAVAGYEYRLNGGSWVDAGNVNSVNLTSLTASTAYTTDARAYDLAGNRSTPVISGSFTTSSSGGATGIALAFTPSRTSCIAPCSVTFDASATTASGTTRPFHDIRYTWNFGDNVTGAASSCGSTILAGEGFWACGAQPGTKSKNQAEGPETAHVFQSPGTFNVCLTGQNALGSSSPLCQTITVTDGATTAWAGTNTICFSSSGNFTGCPSGASQVTVSGEFGSTFNSNKAAGKRYLLRRGDTFNISSSASINVTGPSMIGAYGSGAKPILQATTNTVSMFAIDSPTWSTSITSDWRFQDLDLRGDGFVNTFGFYTPGTFKDFTFDRIDFSHMNKAFSFNGLLLEAGEPIFKNAVIQDVRSVGLVTACSANGENAMYVAAESMHILGVYINNQNTGEHGIRSHWARKSSVTNNTVTGICSGKVAITLRGTEDGGLGMAAGTVYNEQIVVADNAILDNPSGTISLGPQNGNYAEKGRHVIVERNIIRGGGQMGLLWTDITVRNNLLIDVSPIMNIGWDDNTGNLPVPTRINAYNNSIYTTSSSPGLAFIFFAGGGSATLNSSGTTFEFKNNLYYTANSSGPFSFDITGGSWSAATITSSNNSNTVASFATSPNWTTTLPTTAAGFKPLAGSYAIGSGAVVPVYTDFFGIATPATPDLGAVVH